MPSSTPTTPLESMSARDDIEATTPTPAPAPPPMPPSPKSTPEPEPKPIKT